MKTLQIKYIFFAFWVLPMRMVVTLAEELLGDRKVKSWSLIGLMFFLPITRPLYVRGEKKFKALTTQLNKSNRGLAFKTICIALGIVLIIFAL